MQPLDQLFTQIAKEHLGIETHETRLGEDLDFHDAGVWNLRCALEAAYNAGLKQGAQTSDRKDLQ